MAKGHKTKQRLELEEIREIFATSPDLILVTNSFGNFTKINPSVTQTLGYAPSEMIGQSGAKFIAPDDLESTRDEMRLVRHGRTMRNFRTRYVAKDGRIVNLSWSGVWFEPTHQYFFIGRDVGEQERTEKAIQAYAQREQLLIATVQSSTDAIVTKDLEGVITSWNESAEKLYGYSADEAIGSHIDIIVPTELRGEVREILATIGKGERVSHYETVRKTKDGRRIDVSLSVSPIRSASGEIIGAAKSARDIGASKRAQESLRDSEQLARDIINSALDGFVQVNEFGKVSEWNPKAEEIFGWSKQEALGKQLHELYLPVDTAPYFAIASSQAPVPIRREVDAVRKDGRKIKIEISITPLRRRDGYIYNGFARDLTEKFAAEEQLRHAQKMESLGQLTGGIAHDFNNILTVITSTIDILAAGVADKPVLTEVVRMIGDSADRGAKLTTQLLAYARKQPLQPRPVDLNALLTEMERLLESTLGEHIERKLHLEPDAWHASVDPIQLTTALVNVAVNARDAMPNGGKLILETKNVELDEAYARANADVLPGEYVMISVSDTGSGIPRALRDKIFEPFFTTKDIGRGTGLGLSMVYGFVKQSRGHVKVYSEEGVGTSFKIYLPRASIAGQKPKQVNAPTAATGGTETILIVEDDRLVRESTVMQLHALGYTTLAASNAAEAINIVNAGGTFDLLFTDVVMPGTMNGPQLARELEKRCGAIKVVFTSGYSENAIIHHGQLDPGVILLAKPFRKDELARLIRLTLDSPASAIS